MVPFAWLPQNNSGGLLKINWVMGRMKAGLKQGLKVLKEQLPKQLENKYWDAIGARGFAGACFGEGRGYFFKGYDGS
jgi:hypothetical protein